jgi:hypothetical protein
VSYLEKAKQAEEKYKKKNLQGYRAISAELSGRAESAVARLIDSTELPVCAESAVARLIDVERAVHQLETEILSGQIGPTPLRVHGEPLGLVLPLDEVARLLRLGAKQRAG